MTRTEPLTQLDIRQDGRRFNVAGLSRVAARVAEALAELGGQVTLIYCEDRGGLAQLLPPAIERHEHGGQLQSEFEHLHVGDADCLPALSDDDLENFEADVGVSVVASDLPLVLSAVDTTIADLMETRVGSKRQNLGGGSVGMIGGVSSCSRYLLPSIAFDLNPLRRAPQGSGSRFGCAGSELLAPAVSTYGPDDQQESRLSLSDYWGGRDEPSGRSDRVRSLTVEPSGA